MPCFTATVVRSMTSRGRPHSLHMSALDQIWREIETDAAQGLVSEFSVWTRLLAAADRAALGEVRRAYNAFLAEYPLCYVYWHKLAEHESRHGGGPEAARGVYERAVAAGLGRSVDLWLHYARTLQAQLPRPLVRDILLHALDAVGLDFSSHSLWEAALAFEAAEEGEAAHRRVAALWGRLLRTPLEQLQSYWERYKLFVDDTPLAHLLTPDEAASLAGFDEQQGKAWLLSREHAAYEATLAEVHARLPYETVVLQVPFFAPKPLDSTIITTWERYLKYEEARGDPSRIVQLYERCLLPCANYPGFWLSYSRYLEQHKDPASALRVLERACGLQKRLPTLHLEWALLLEQHGQIDAARAVYLNVRRLVPAHVESALRLIGFERRQGNFTRIDAIYAEIQSQAAAPTAAYLYLHQAKTLQSIDPENIERARQVLRFAAEKFPGERLLWSSWATFEVGEIHSPLLRIC